MEGIQVSIETAGSQNHISIIKVGGYIDTTTSSELERALDSLLKEGKFYIIVDLGNVDYISSAGWGIFISEIKSIRENGGDLKLARMVPDVYEIFELLEFHHILDVHDAADEAIHKFEVLGAAGKPVAKEITLPKTQNASETSQAETGIERERTQEITEEKITPQKQSLSEKIKMIIKENPSFSARRVKKELDTKKFGFTQLGWFAVRSEMKRLKLNSRSKRRAFAAQ
jgi:anti-sigma B factor antagonist